MIRLAAAADVPEGGILRVAETPVGALALVRWDGRFLAARDRCPHAAALLSEGFVEGRFLVCPTHFAEFDLETGAARNAPAGCPNVAVFPIVHRHGELFLAASSPSSKEPSP